MKNQRYILIAFLFGLSLCAFSKKSKDTKFPDGTPIPQWFNKTTKLSLSQYKNQYPITDFGVVHDSLVLQTKAIQKAIDEASAKGGGVIIVPKGTFLTGALFFKPNTCLYLAQGAVLKGSENIEDFPKIPSRMEGQNLDYFAALINAYGVDNFAIFGQGTINGNGLKYWKTFWQRRKENKNCTNLEVSRPRLVFVWKCKNVQFQDVKLINSGFWTNHFYQCTNVKLLNLYIFSPKSPVKAPSTDAIDIDACTNFLVDGTYLSVNDDAIALKGGKGPKADTDANNGMNANIIIRNCVFGFCHSALTCGSESIHNRNIIMRDCTVKDAQRMFWLKMREDTPQLYEYITIENINGSASKMICAGVWSQFFDLKGETKHPFSLGDHIMVRNINFKCDTFFELKLSENSKVSNITLENLNVEAKNGSFDKTKIENLHMRNITIKKIETQSVSSSSEKQFE